MSFSVLASKRSYKSIKRFLLIGFAVLQLQALSAEATQNATNSLSLSVTDKRNVIYHRVGEDLLLRVVKEEMGWNVQVTRRPFTRNSSWNLLYHSLRWHGPYPSQIYAWHVVDHYFQNERALDVRGYPYEVHIVLINPVIEGTGAQAKFKSGTIKISWKHKT
jgi:hypothetical protein